MPGRTQAWTVPSRDLQPRLQPRRPAHREQQQGRDRAGLGHRDRQAARTACGGPTATRRPSSPRLRTRSLIPSDDASRVRALAARPPTPAERRRPAPEGRRDVLGAVRPERQAHRVRRRQGPASRCATWLGARGQRSTAPRRRSTAPCSALTASTSRRVPGRGDVVIWRRDRPARPERAFKGHRGTRQHARVRPRRPASSPVARTGRSASGIRVRRRPLVLRGHEDEITTAVVLGRRQPRCSPSSQDGTLRLWDARTRRTHWRCCSRIRARSTTLR